MIARILPTLLVLALLAGLSGCGYNTMQVNEEAVSAAWGDLQASLQRRADLVPNLVQTVKGAAAHEKETLQAVIEARAKATSIQVTPEMLSDPKALSGFQAAQSGLASALSKLMVVVERYPQIKANENFLALQHQLEGTENRIAVARKRYNDAVKVFNTSIRTFPNSLTNSVLLNLDPKAYYQADEAAQTVPKVDFGDAKEGKE